jgi:hypothetical protein
MHFNFYLATLFVAILIDLTSGQTCRKEKTWLVNGIGIHDCDSVSFKKLSQSFVDVEKVVGIFAEGNGNSFAVIDGQFFDKLDNLVFLRLYQCRIDTIEENAFSNLKALHSLYLSGNKIKKLQENTFRELANLTVLYLDENQIETIPKRLFEGNGKLERLGMSGNKIKRIPIGVFDALVEMKRLSMQDNGLERIHRSSFKQNQMLRKLELSNNRIHGIAEGAFEKLENLTRLQLANNSCINVTYKDPINFDQVATDLEECYDNYENFQPAVCSKSPDLPNSDQSQPTKSPSYLIIISISAILSIGGVITIFSFIRRTKNVFKELTEYKDFELKKRQSNHHYSMPDTSAQIEHAQWQELEEELKSE